MKPTFLSCKHKIDIKSEPQCHLSMSNTNEVKSVVLWYLNGCLATFYKAQQDDEPKKKVLIDTISFTNKAYLAYRQVNILVKAKTQILLNSRI